MKKTSPQRIIVSFGIFLFLLGGCAKNMDNPQPSDSTVMKFSALVDAQRGKTKEHLSGVWLTKRGKIEEGFYLAPDGKVVMQNIYTTKGTNWEFFGGDSLRISMQGASAPVTKVYAILALDDSTLTLLPVGSTEQEVYHKKANRHYEFTAHHQDFHGALQPSQILEHSFEVKTLFDGSITLECDNKGVKFTVKKDGIEITEEPTRQWEGSFVPGTFVIIVRGAALPRPGTPSNYTVTVDEKEIKR